MNINFTYNGESIMIQCQKSDYFEDILQKYGNKIGKDLKEIYFLYKGGLVNKELKLEQLSLDEYEKEIKILVNDLDIEDEELDTLKLSNDIICPECLEDCIINIIDYKITLNNCHNKHTYSNILINELNDYQKINEAKIICRNNECNINKSKAYENKFFICCDCNINLCPMCKSIHNKEHIIIDYELKNYICNVHGEKYIFYSKKNDKNLCDLCIPEIDENEEYIYLNKLLKNKEMDINELRIKIDDLKKEINEKDDRYNKVLENMEIYYNLANRLKSNYNIRKKNYKKLININNITDYNKEIVKDIDKIINENNHENKSKYLNEIYTKMSYINEIILKYKINNNDKIRIFGDFFVLNNKDKLEMVINEKTYDLDSFFILKDKNIKSDILEIKLKQIKNLRNLSFMFSECSNLIEIKNLSDLKTENVSDMKSMFSQCSNLSSIPDISNWNTSNVKNMSSIFYKCSNLLALPDISKWNIDKVIDISYIFRECSSLISLPNISNWNTINVSNFEGIFYKCSKLSILPDISLWNTNKVTNMSFMFSVCSSLITLSDISKWNT